MLRTLLVLTASLFLSLQPIWAEAIFMKDGRIIYGKIQAQNSTGVDVQTPYGRLQLKKSDINKINYEQGLGTVTAILADRTISGILVSITNEKVVIRSDDESQVEHVLKRDSIESLVMKKFTGRRENVLEIAWGTMQATGTFGKSVRPTFGHVGLLYRRLLMAETPSWSGGLSIAYFRLSPKPGGTPLKNAFVTFTPILTHLQWSSPVARLVAMGKWSEQIWLDVFVGNGIGLVTLARQKTNTNATYYTFQPGIGWTYPISDRILTRYRFAYTHMFQEELDFQGFSHTLGLGISF